mgnify:CR=1 FL=1
MSINNFALADAVAERLHEAIEKGLPDMSSRRKADSAMVVINTLARLSIRDLAIFNEAMVDYITLPKDMQEEALSRLCVKITEFKIGA